MFIVQLKLIGERARVAELLTEHKAWLQQGFADGVFLASGNLQGQPGGGILAHGVTRATLEVRLQQDPFSAHNLVSREIIEITPSKTDPRLDFLREVQA